MYFRQRFMQRARRFMFVLDGFRCWLFSNRGEEGRQSSQNFAFGAHRSAFVCVQTLVKKLLAPLALCCLALGTAHAQTTPAPAASTPAPAASTPAPVSDTPYFPDVPRNHWAFAAVQRLAGAGILEGYPAPPAPIKTATNAKLSPHKTMHRTPSTAKMKVSVKSQTVR